MYTVIATGQISRFRFGPVLNLIVCACTHTYNEMSYRPFDFIVLLCDVVQVCRTRFRTTQCDIVGTRGGDRGIFSGFFWARRKRWCGESGLGGFTRTPAAEETRGRGSGSRRLEGWFFRMLIRLSLSFLLNSIQFKRVSTFFMDRDLLISVSIR